jgi:hypothetical protein
MIPHVIVVEPALVIYKIYNSSWFFGSLEDLRHDLRAGTKKCRPDWDITTPELKMVWQQGQQGCNRGCRTEAQPRETISVL